MLFSSNVFIFVYLPVVLLVNYALKFNRRAQNVFLCLASLLFYAWGEPRFVLVMMASILVNWFFGLLVGKFKEYKNVRWLIALDVFINLSIIFIYKYMAFTVKNLNLVLHAHWKVPEIALPIGISFFTFQAISYVIDVYRGRGEAQKNLLNVGLYISFFPQLIAGPIVRYETIADQINNRKENLQDFSDGVVRFIIGLGKKVLLANNMALIADHAFGFGNGTVQWFGADMPLTAGMAWLGALAYTFQIYFDFSGYSDMAIGLGQMLGFNFNKNFDYPYISTSVSEFWRRWHISLGSWFRDYIYIPLGGNRVSTGRHIRNILVVWALTGLWHGASWNFVFWGVYYGLLLLAEKFLLGRFLEKAPVWLRNLYTMFAVIIGWVFFSQTTPAAIGKMLGAMFGLGASCFADRASLYALKSGLILMIISVISCRPGLYQYFKRLARRNTYLAAVINAILFFLCIAYMIYSSYTPFMYQQF